LQIACENTENKPYLLMPRSSISKTPLRLSNSIGLIDGGYRGEIMAAIDNIKTEDYRVEPGQRLFQLVAMDGAPIHFELVDELSDTSRGSGGFGSTGK
jgi:dUTP pyrophosphatase